MSTRVDLKTADLVVGRRYKVVLEGCLVDGWFIDTFVKEGRGEEGEIEALLFSNASIGPTYGSWRVEEVDD
jgi:hypothetical protein